VNDGRVTAPTVGQMLHHYRTTNNLTQVELGERLGVSQSTVDRWLNEESVPSRENHRAIWRVLGVDESALAVWLEASNRRQDERRRRRGGGWRHP
jgi:transcriptional regulator with XRE-family HTH domain